MFRRRPLRPRPLRGRQPPLGRHPLPPAVAEAERLMQSGQFAEAAARFEDLAHRAEERGRLQAAAKLNLQASRCYVEQDDLDRADDAAERAIHLLIRAGRPDHVRQILPRVLAGLERHGRQADAERLRREVEETFQGVDFAPGQRRAAARLPAKCSNCGAPIKPDEVAWAGPASAECPYCGGVVKADLPGSTT